MKTKTKFLTTLTAAVLMLPSCAPSGMTRVSQTDISSAFTRSDLSVASGRGAVPVVFSGVIPATDKTAAERALLAALPTYYTANLTWRAATPADPETVTARLVLAFGPDPIYPAERLCLHTGHVPSGIGHWRWTPHGKGRLSCVPSHTG